MVENCKHPARRDLLALIGVGAVATLAGQPAAASPPALSKASVGYRDVPYQGEVCAQCVYFIYQPATGSTPQSLCKLVAGRINPAGWCELWAPKTA